jgi:hypothetical protein
VNDQTDRVYLVTDDGMAECLHETNMKEPLYHNPKPAPAKKEEAKQGAAPNAAPAKAVEKPAKSPAKAKATEPAEKPAAEGKAPAKKDNAGTEIDPFG